MFFLSSLLPVTQVNPRIKPNSEMKETAGAIIQQRTWTEPSLKSNKDRNYKASMKW